MCGVPLATIKVDLTFQTNGIIEFVKIIRYYLDMA